MIESVLLAATPIHTYDGDTYLTNASGFFFERDQRLFLVSSRHVFIDEPSGHRPDRIEIEFHTDADNLASSGRFSMPLFHNGKSVWRQAEDSSGGVDVAVIEIIHDALPATASFFAFGPANIPNADYHPEVGSPLLVIGFPLGFHDTLHHLPVVRNSIIASPFGFRFQGNGYFLADGRTHRGISGAPVLIRTLGGETTGTPLPYYLLGVHSARLDVGTRDHEIDEALGLNCVWYADVVMALTE